MRGRYHNSTELVKSYCREPIFIMLFKHQHNLVSSAYSGVFEDISHFVAVYSYVLKRKNTLLIFGVAPYNRTLVRRFFRYFVHNVISEIEIIGIVKRDFFECPVFIGYFRTKSLINAHICSLLSAVIPMRRKRP